jgi:hypothetical protein
VITNEASHIYIYRQGNYSCKEQTIKFVNPKQVQYVLCLYPGTHEDDSRPGAIRIGFSVFKVTLLCRNFNFFKIISTGRTWVSFSQSPTRKIRGVSYENSSFQEADPLLGRVLAQTTLYSRGSSPFAG